MGKKKGKEGRKKGRKIVDGLSTAEMSREQLLGHIKRLQNEIDREREERNFFMLEREKLFSLWSLALEKITIEKDKARLREIHLDNVRESKEDDMNLQKQKIRFLMTEQLRKLSESRLDYLYRMRDLQKEFWRVENTLRQNVQDEHLQVNNMRMILLETVRDEQLKNVGNISQVRREYAAEVRHVEVESNVRVMKYEERVDLECKQDVIQLQIIKDEQINELMKMHEQQLKQLKDYYNTITVNNLAIITTLQEQLQENKSRQSQLVIDLQRYKTKGHDLQHKVQQLENKMIEWSMEEKKMASRITQVRRMDKKVQLLTTDLRRMEITQEALVQKNLAAEEEKVFLKQFLAKSLLENQMKSGMNQILYKIEKKNYEHIN